MNNESLCLEYYSTIPKEYEEILYHGISEGAFQAKGLGRTGKSFSRQRFQ